MASVRGSPPLRQDGRVHVERWTPALRRDILIDKLMAKKKQSNQDPLNEVVKGLENILDLLDRENAAVDWNVLSLHVDSARSHFNQGSDPAVQTTAALKGNSGFPSAEQFKKASESAGAALDAIRKHDRPSTRSSIAAMLHSLGK